MKRWAIFFGVFIGIIILLADTRHLGSIGMLYDVPFGDKIGHFVLFGLLSMTVNLAVLEAYPGAKQGQLALRASLWLALPIGLEELSQRWFPSRTSSVFDLMASYLGVAFFAWLAVRLKSQVGKPRSSGADQ
jgi:polysaccharide biosynthesis protein VpsQ